MHHRARSIGADLQISSSSAGTEVTLLLPAPMKAQGAHGVSDMPM
jgi:signal transduction histidine kinase